MKSVTNCIGVCVFIICLFKKKRCATPVIGIQKSCILSCESIKSYCWNDQLLLISNVRERRRFYGMSTKSNFCLKKIFLLWNTFIMIRELVFCFKLCHSLPTRCRIPKLWAPPQIAQNGSGILGNLSRDAGNGSIRH
jgi:hypothetical protein